MIDNRFCMRFKTNQIFVFCDDAVGEKENKTQTHTQKGNFYKSIWMPKKKEINPVINASSDE